ncbi:MAG TPA: hypothetical protein VGF17_14915 [Phytomonospora sp.]
MKFGGRLDEALLSVTAAGWLIEFGPRGCAEAPGVIASGVLPPLDQPRAAVLLYAERQPPGARVEIRRVKIEWGRRTADLCRADSLVATDEEWPVVERAFGGLAAAANRLDRCEGSRGCCKLGGELRIRTIGEAHTVNCCMDAFITVWHAVPTAEVHVDAVRAALRDGRLDPAAWAVQAGMGEVAVRYWAEGAPIEDSFEARAWCAAVTTTIPGWKSPRDATTPTRSALPRF